MWWVVMYLDRATSSNWISAHGHVKSGVSIVYQGGVLTQVLQRSMVDSNVISFGAGDFLRNCSEEAAPITENSVTNVWCNLITTYRSYPSWRGKVVANSYMAVCSELHQVSTRLWGVADQYFHQAVGK